VFEYYLTLIVAASFLPWTAVLEQQRADRERARRVAARKKGKAGKKRAEPVEEETDEDDEHEWSSEKIVAAIFAMTFVLYLLRSSLEKFLKGFHMGDDAASGLITFTVPLLVALKYFSKKPVQLRTAFGGAVALGLFFWTPPDRFTIFRARSFFACLSVDEEDGEHTLYSGTTIHGVQDMRKDKRGTAMTYYTKKSSIGETIDMLNRIGGPDAPPNLAVVGLGVGTLATYAQQNQVLDYYEIDPWVERIARNPRFFTYLTDAEARQAKLNVVIGDARIRLQEAPDAYYDLIAVDAFSSDAIPLHLITREAVELYQRKIKPNGIIAMHITNRYVNLTPVLAALAQSVNMQAVTRWVDEDKITYWNKWFFMSRDKVAAFHGLADDEKKWAIPRFDSGLRIWTDDYANLLSVLHWKNQFE
jgi:hypothetical protein